MRRIVFSATATLALAVAAASAPGRAEAMTLPSPAAIRAATDTGRLTHTVTYACRRAWRCGPYDCGWRRVCTWAGWRPDWRTRPYWRRHQWRKHYW